MKRRIGLFVIACLAQVGCATGGTGRVVQIGPDLYMIGGLGKFTDFSASAVKARMFNKRQGIVRAKTA